MGVLAPTYKNFWKNPLVAPLDKFLPTPMHTSMKNDTIFVKNGVVVLHLAKLFNNTNAESDVEQGYRRCTVYSAKLQISVTNNFDKILPMFATLFSLNDLLSHWTQ